LDDVIDQRNKLKKSAQRLGVSVNHMPRHLAVIMDGNGRWAQARGMARVEGHRQGAKTAEAIALYGARFGIESLSMYSFSIENWKRPQEEINGLMALYEEYLIRMRPMLIRENVRLVHLGRKAGLPGAVLKELNNTMDATRGNDGMILAFALNYGGRTEIIDATRAIARACVNGQLDVDAIDEDCINQHLYTASMPDPDLMIRTANELRVSNFLLWQISYSEFYVTETFWPDFDETDLDQAVLAYARRDRRFGALSQ